MTHQGDSQTSIRVTDTIARRQRRGRIAGRMLWPIMAGGVALTAISGWFIVPTAAVMLVLQILVFIALNQSCPLCRARNLSTSLRHRVS
jgi:hypothetical protein